MRWPAFVLLLVTSAAAQNLPTLRSDTRVVQIDVVAKDSRGRIVEDLSRQDFTIKDDSKPRAVQIFSINRGETEPADVAPPVVPLPPNTFSNKVAIPGSASMHATVILLDTINDYFDNYARSRAQVVSLIGRLRRDERVAIYVLNHYQGLLILQDYTTDRDLLIRNLNAYIPGGMSPAPVGMEGLREAVRQFETPPKSEREFFMRNGAESLRSAIQAIAGHMASVPGRKSLLWISQGFPPRQIRDSSDSLAKTIEVMNQSNVELDAIDSNGLAGPPRRWGPGGVASMQEIAERTGGKAYYNRNDLDTAMAEAIEEKRTSYTLAFYLGDDERDGRFHRLSVQVDRPHVDLHYRQGYIAGAEHRMEQTQKKAELETAFLSPLESTGVGITMHVEPAPGKPRGTLRIRAVLDPATISLIEKGDRWNGKFDDLFVEMNAEGKPIARISSSRQFQLNAAQRRRFEQDGLVYSLTIPLETGAVKVRAVIRDSQSGHVGSLTMLLK
jgi:VWFA-related protein